MKVVLSRKGFDAENGGGPSPILPDGTMVSLPIPSNKDERTYADLRCKDGTPLAKVVADLDLFDPKSSCHLDPDLAPWTVDRQQGWLPSFGQTDQASSHLRGQGVGVGDLFLFFGWFRQVEEVKGRLRFVRGAGSDLHVIYGWLEVADVLCVGEKVMEPKWLLDHPHCHPRRRSNPTNTIFVSSSKLSLNTALPGGGVFSFRKELVLTKEGMTRTKWALDPDVFRSATISYHSDNDWKKDHFQSRSKGQEFVIEGTPGVQAWAHKFFGVDR